jgi:undecaprenyl diphosphate synthase
MTLAIALNYGSRTELVAAARQLAGDVAAGRLSPDQIDEAHIEAALDTSGLPPLDLVIRTSGEQRLSNFLLWQAAYAELLFLDTLWPDFDEKAMRAALADYARRERRYGGL